MEGGTNSVNEASCDPRDRAKQSEEERRTTKILHEGEKVESL